ncbi:isatin hydrolase-like [Branchiostoma floridae x Branchiostoma belcheri]
MGILHGATVFVIMSLMTPVHSVLPGNPRVIDMTHTFDENTIYWPTLRQFKRTGVLRNYTADGTWREESDIEGAEHGGTHLDAPAHFSKNKWRSHDIPVERLMGPAAVVDVSPKAAADADYLVTAEDFQLWEEKHGKIPDGCLLFIKTGWGRFWPNKLLYLGTDSRNSSLLHFPGLHPDGARWLVQNRGMHAVGIDTASIDYGQSKLRPDGVSFGPMSSCTLVQTQGTRHYCTSPDYTQMALGGWYRTGGCTLLGSTRPLSTTDSLRCMRRIRPCLETISQCLRTWPIWTSSRQWGLWCSPCR